MKHILLGLLSCVAVGCVSQAKFDDLKQRYDEAQNQLAERQQRVGSLGASVKEAEAEVGQLKNRNAQVAAELRLLESERAQLDADQRRMADELNKLMDERSRLTESNTRLGAALAELQLRKAETDRRVNEFKTLIARFKSLIDAGTLKVTLSDGRMVLQLPTDVLFDSGSAQLSDTGSQAITQVTGILKEVPARRYQVEGHTDNVPIHTPRYASNWDLAAARGLGVMRAMISAGIAGANLSAASFGEFHPVSSNETLDGRRANRRIEIIVVPDLSLLPGYEELRSIVDAAP
ncbi:MAG: hypothetical protein RL701_4773 [Pseudomonadota bacterium]|jgi:chemotaxis protein MotB